MHACACAKNCSFPTLEKLPHAPAPPPPSIKGVRFQKMLLLYSWVCNTKANLLFQQLIGHHLHPIFTVTTLHPRSFRITHSTTMAMEMPKVNLSCTNRRESRRCLTCKIHWFQPNCGRRRRRRTMTPRLMSEVSERLNRLIA